ncbi:MAG TPA: NAD(P)/FAD-dependent oxidoreductase [bacterium]
MNLSPCDVIVIGAGASGLMCAATAGARGRSVLVLDHGAQAGAKIRISGGGRCNFTNREVSAGNYRSANPDFCRSALARFTPRDVLALLERHGVRWEEREQGQLFCLGSARQVVDLLLAECDRGGARLELECRVGAVRAGTGGFVVETARGAVRCASLVVATGGLSYPKLGASDFGLNLARQFGLGVVQPGPALVPFVLAAGDREACRALAGVSLEASIGCGGRDFAGRVLFTHRGLSGPAALQASLFWHPGEPLAIDLAPGKDVLELLLSRRASRAEPKSVLGEMLPRRLAALRCEQLGATRPLNQLGERQLRALAEGVRAWIVVPAETEGYATAEVTAGGVDTAELSSKTMEARRVPGLYFVGEVVDVTGALGGYNLHWAWASGMTAGTFA